MGSLGGDMRYLPELPLQGRPVVPYGDDRLNNEALYQIRLTRIEKAFRLEPVDQIPVIYMGSAFSPRYTGMSMAVMGDLPCALFAAGPPDDIYADVRELVLDVGPTGLLLKPGCEILINAKPENVEAFVAASRENGS